MFVSEDYSRLRPFLESPPPLYPPGDAGGDGDGDDKRHWFLKILTICIASLILAAATVIVLAVACVSLPVILVLDLGRYILRRWGGAKSDVTPGEPSE